MSEKQAPRNKNEQVKLKRALKVPVSNRDQALVLALSLLVNVLQEKLDDHIKKANKLGTNDHPQRYIPQVTQTRQRVDRVVRVHTGQ